MKTLLSLALICSFSLYSFAQEQPKEQTPTKKKPLSMDMNDVKAAPKEDKPKEEIKETVKPANPSPQPSPQPTPSPATVDPEAGWPAWLKAQKQMLVSYLESQIKGENPGDYFYYGNSAAADTVKGGKPWHMFGIESYKMIEFSGDSETCTWHFTVDAVPTRNSAGVWYNTGHWYAVVKIAPGGDRYKIHSLIKEKSPN